MTLDDLIERLLEIRRVCPAAATATVIGFNLDAPVYRRGEVWFGDFDPEYCDLVEIEVMPSDPPPTSEQVH
jgi:hypothetical protein